MCFMLGKQLVDILKCVLTDVYVPVMVDDWNKLVGLAKSQGVLSCVAFYVEKIDREARPSEEITLFLKQYLLKSALVSAEQLKAIDDMQNALEKAGVYSVRLKGSCTKQRYSNDVLRAMGDIDILYKPEQHKLFRSVLENELGYGNFQEGRKNDTYSKAPNLCIEAHRQLVSSESFFCDYYKSVWERCVQADGYNYRYEMTIEDEYIFNIIHLLEHFRHGGIGVRFIMDIFVYEHKKMNFEYVEKVLSSFNLLDFYGNIKKLSKCWFEGEQPNELTDELSRYIFSGGVFGSKEHSKNLAVSKGGRLAFLKRVCFPEYDDMVSMFPWLKGKKILLPAAWLIRAFKSIIFRRRNVKFQFENAKKGDAEKGREIRNFYSQCGVPENII